MKRGLSFCIIGLVLFGTGWFFGRPAYRAFKERRAVERARDSLAQGDYRNASLNARLALTLNPANIDACQLMAEMAGLVRSPQVLDWHRRLVEISPTPENNLALARAAMLVQEPPYPLATQVLARLQAGGQTNVSFHCVAAELAIRLQNHIAAEEHFQAAARLEPGNELHQLNLAVVRLLSTNQGTAAPARVFLRQLAARTNVLALRSLIVDELNHTNLSAAKELSDQLLHQVPAGLEDELQHLGILHRLDSAGFQSFLATLQRKATNAISIYTVCSWLTGHGLAQQAQPWIGTLPQAVQSEMPVPLATVDTFLAAKDWGQLEAFLRNKNWNELEFLRLAWLSETAAAQNEPDAARARWRSALRQAAGRLGALNALLSLSRALNRGDWREEVLWSIVESFPREQWAVQDLGGLYFQSGNTRGLRKQSEWVLAHDPNDYMACNNFIATSMLLNLELPKAHQLAKSNFEQHPQEPIIVATYAYSLHLQGKTDAGLAVLDQMPPAAQTEPAVALYHGLLLACRGQRQQAMLKLDLASRANLLPEEMSLLEKVRKQL